MKIQAVDLPLDSPRIGGEQLPSIPLGRVCDGVLDAVGKTPLIRLRRYLPEAEFQLFAKLEALNPAGSIKDRPAKRILEHALSTGLGAGLRPALCEPSVVDDYVHVSDLDCVVGCRRAMEREAIFVGGSSGGVLSAVAACAGRIPAGSMVVALLPDRGERYLDTVFSDEWVLSHFGDAGGFGI